MKTIIILMLLITSSVAMADEGLEFKVGYGEQKLFEGFELGFEYRKDVCSEVFILAGFEFESLSKPIVKEYLTPLRYKYTYNNRDDYSIYTGIGIKFNKISILTYVGVGQSRRYHDHGLVVIAPDLKSSELTLIDVKTVKEIKSTIGMKFEYSFGNRDVVPYIDISTSSYEFDKQQTGVMIGLQFRF